VTGEGGRVLSDIGTQGVKCFLLSLLEDVLMKVLVTGATGFTGSYVVQKLINRGVHVTCLVRPSSDTRALCGTEAHLVRGQFEDAGTMNSALQGADALVNIASLGFGHAPGIVRATQESGVTRGVFISTTAIFTSLNAPSRAVRLQAEQCIKESGLEYTILRPTMIYGSSRDRNMSRLIRCLHRWPVIPVFGAATNLQQPVFVEDVAEAVTSALLSNKTVRRCYNISGADALTCNEVIDSISRLLNRRVHRWHLSSKASIKLLQICERLGLKFPIRAEQVQRLNEDKVFAHEDAVRDFGFGPRHFTDGIRAELQEMGLARDPIAPETASVC